MTEINSFRRNVGKARYDGMSYENITELCDITGRIMERRQVLNEHISQMDHSRLVKTARNVTRPTKRWNDSL